MKNEKSEGKSMNSMKFDEFQLLNELFRINERGNSIISTGFCNWNFSLKAIAADSPLVDSLEGKIENSKNWNAEENWGINSTDILEESTEIKENEKFSEEKISLAPPFKYCLVGEEKTKEMKKIRKIEKFFIEK